MGGKRTIAGVILGLGLVAVLTGPAFALEPKPLNEDWLWQFEAKMNAIAEVRHSWDFNGESTNQPFTKRKGGFFESYLFLSQEFSRKDKAVAFRATLAVFGLADPGNEDIARFYNGSSDAGYDVDVAPQELWGEVMIHPGGWIRAGIQEFNSDHAGLIYNDSDRGVRYRGEGKIGDKPVEWNVAYFAKTYDDALSQLNTEDNRPWHVIILNTKFPVATMQVVPSVHVSMDRTGPTDTDVVYLGVSSAGMLGPFQVLAAYYWATGNQEGGLVNPSDQTVSAHQFLVDVGLPLANRKYIPHVGIFAATGDSDPLNHHATGFDAIYDRVEAWGFNHFIVRNRINLGPGSLARAHSGLFTLRDFDEPANFVNPGIIAANAGLTTNWTDKFMTDANVGPAFLWSSAVPELVLGRDVSNYIGWAANVNARYKLSSTVSIFGGISSFFPTAGATDIFGGHRPAVDGVLGIDISI